MGLNVTYLSRIENDRLDSAQTPREDTLQKIADVLETDADELLLLANRILGFCRSRILAKPNMFRRVLDLSDEDLERLVNKVEHTQA